MTAQNFRSAAWTDADRDRLRELVVKRASALRAAAAFNRTVTSVRSQARKMGLSFPTIRETRSKWATTANTGNNWQST